MRNYLVLAFCLFTYLSFSQKTSTKNNLDKGLLVNCSVGVTHLVLIENNSTTLHASLSLPNLSLGYRFNSKVAVFVHFPGSTFKSEGKTRGFEGVLVGSQYWIKPKLWVKGGVGLCLDAPAFWTVDNPKTADFRIGFPEVMVGAGYEFYKGKKLVMDAQYKCYFGGTSSTINATRFGISNSIGIGFNWY